ncbi:DUF3892 domain-containing protein [Phenylobacterium sp. LH3H17]|uniref:DUF3892 domain-containing protein n=1 Tax=Phenylobacterium sp. LH3H17 TaxID=2903901 RepID=UPI0020C99E66|nr:DUF3892 domain-containing protein [Phenylobacterium sp. LH3H17]UTP38990.1 DUF3892 domain-containing protein [Phenylobacterium sp. LH3H17]
MAKKIIDAKNDSKGNVKAVLLEGNKTFTDKEAAIRMADRNQISNAHVVRRENATPHLRTNPDGSRRNNLDEMAED